MISGAHVVLFSREAEADRAVLRDVFGLEHVDAGGGWLIFALPPAEIAVHPDADGGQQQVYLMCEDVAAIKTRLEAAGLVCSAVADEGWGQVMTLSLPSGAGLGIYQQRHPVPH